MIELSVQPDRPDEERLSGPPPRRRRRQVLVAACVLALLAGATGAAAPGPMPPWRRMTTFNVGSDQSRWFVFLGDSVLILEQGTGTLVAHALGGGRVRWRAALRFSELGYAHQAGGTVLVTGSRQEEVFTIGLDPTTGAVRWELPGVLRGLTPDGEHAVIGRYDEGLLSAVAAESGTALWSFEAGARADVETGGQISFLQGVNLPAVAAYTVRRADGTIVRLDLASGRATDLVSAPPAAEERPAWADAGTGLNLLGRWNRPGGDLIVASPISGLDRSLLLDPASGAVRLALGTWEAVGYLDGELVVVMRNGNDVDTRTWIGMVPADGAPVVRVLGLFGPNGPAASSCRLHGAWLSCDGLHQIMVVPLRADP